MAQYSFPIPFLTETNHPGWSKDLVEWYCDRCGHKTSNRDEMIKHVLDTHNAGVIWPVFSSAGKEMLVTAWSLLYGPDATRTILRLMNPRGELEVLGNLGVKPEWVESDQILEAETHLAYWFGVGDEQTKRSNIYSSDKVSDLMIRLQPKQLSDIEAPLEKLRLLLTERNNDESQYQELLVGYPWIFGAQYVKIERHTQLDDRNIPDFTGVRIRDEFRDIFEIKPPFTKMFRDTGGFSAEFNDAWNQAEKYLDFARRDEDYLRRKGLRFDNPECYLILGYDFSEEQICQVRTKERLTPAIKVITYNDLLAYTEHTIGFIQQLYNPSQSRF